MNATAIFALLEKGLTALPLLIDAGMNIYNLVERLRTVAAAAKNGQTVSDADLAELEADLDSALAEFNSDLPE